MNVPAPFFDAEISALLKHLRAICVQKAAKGYK